MTDWQSVPCVEWTDRLHTQGYGVFSERGREVYAHRRAWETAYGPIPDGLFVLHYCDNRPCTEPLHLWLGTHAQNQADKIAKGRARRGPGRPFTPGHDPRRTNGFDKRRGATLPEPGYPEP